MLDKRRTFTQTTRGTRSLQLILTFLAVAGFYQGFRVFKKILVPPSFHTPATSFEGRAFEATRSRQPNPKQKLPWPKYPGAKQLHVGATQTWRGNTLIQTLESSASPERVMQWYRRRLTGKGWTTHVSDHGSSSGFLSAPASMLKEHPEAFQQENVLRMIDSLHHKTLIMRKKKQVIFITATPTKKSTRHEIRIFSYEVDQQPEPRRSRYAQKYLPASMPFRQQFEDGEYVSTFIASRLSPAPFLAEWKARLRSEGWEELIGSDTLAMHNQTPGLRMSTFTKENSSTMVMIQPGPENGSLGLVTKIYP